MALFPCRITPTVQALAGACWVMAKGAACSDPNDLSVVVGYQPWKWPSRAIIWQKSPESREKFASGHLL
jgi:hypothetical protein